jgi:hypothetical protein
MREDLQVHSAKTSDNNCSLQPIEESRVNSWTVLGNLLNRHPYLRDRPNFEEQQRRAQSYIALKDAQHRDDLPRHLTIADIARDLDFPFNVVSYWLDDRNQPALFHTLIAHETARREHEAHLPNEAPLHQLDPSHVYEAFRPLRSPEERTSENFAQAIETLYRTIPDPPRIVFAELQPYHQRGPHWLREIAAAIDQHRSLVERCLEVRLRAEDDSNQAIRLAVVGGDTFYLWRRDINPDNWLNIYAHEHFYFSSTDYKDALINEARRHLGLRGDIRLGQLVAGISDYSGSLPTNRHQISDLRREDPIMEGETLHFLLDATNKTLKDVQDQLSHVGSGSNSGGGRILNPRFPDVEHLRSRLYCIIRCDGHVTDCRHVIFTEKNPQRFEYVKSLLRQLGQVECAQYERPGGLVLHAPVVLGRVLERWGMPLGDKCIRNIGLPSAINNGSTQIKCAYLEELIPQDGNFHVDKAGQAVFQWTRGTVVDAGEKAKRYGFESKISSELKHFVRRFSKLREPRYGTDTVRPHFSLRYSQLERLQGSSSSRVRQAAARLKEIIKDNQNRLITDEVGLCESLGIEIAWGPQVINSYPSGRVTVIWHARTRSQDDALRFALEALPADTRKRAMVMDWLVGCKARRGRSKEKYPS